MDPNQNQNQSGQPPESENFGAPPREEVNIRSMESDINSIERGESTPVPESVLPPEDKNEPVFRPETQIGEPLGGGMPEGMEEEKPKSKKTLIIIIAAVVIAGALAAAYFIFLAPKENGGTPPPPPVVTPPPPVSPQHSTFLRFSPAPGVFTVEPARLIVDNLLLNNILSLLQALSQTKQANGTVQEVIISDKQFSQVPAGSFLSAYLTELSQSQISSWFEDDFTAFLYYDKDGAWPGYVMKIKNGVNFDEVKSNMKILESSEAAKRFYLSGLMNLGPFKDGQLNGKPTRYSVGSLPGASFNYLIANNYFIVSTSYNGLKAAAPMLGI